MKSMKFILIGLLGLACHSAEPAKAPQAKGTATVKVVPNSLVVLDQVPCDTFGETPSLFTDFFMNEDAGEAFVKQICIGKFDEEQCAQLFLDRYCSLLETRYYLGNTDAASYAFRQCMALNPDASCFNTMEQVMRETHNKSCSEQSKTNK